MSVLVKEPEVMVKPAAFVAAVADFSEESVRALSAARKEPRWMLDFRLAAWRTFEAMAWPKPTDEAWRRTRLTGFDLKNFTAYATPQGESKRQKLSALLQSELGEMESAASLIFQDGGVHYRNANPELIAQGVIFTDLQSALIEHPALVRHYFMTQAVQPDHNKFTALHAALWDTGAFVYVPKNVTVELPLQAILHQNPGVGGYHHTLLVADEGSHVTVVDDLLGGVDGMQSGVIELVMKDNTVVRYMNLQDFDHSAWNFLTGRAVMGRDTDLRWIQVSWGSRLTKAFLDLDLTGQGGHGELLGLYFPTGRQHIDHQTLQIHRAPNCFSDLLFNGALKERAHNVYMGVIKVLPNAQKTDAFQRNGNLILDGTARADSIPGLEIEADDVRCTHAATASQVEDEYVFYLMARGLTRPQAERMIVQGFFQEVLDRVPVESVQHKLERVIERKIGG
ncbi:MAG: Fe-S cluster assembly protein SufD [Chloroflexi bacterium]|nr:Fe-S cluster assembly protein SufD [Chloroflexota bacterium]